MDQRNFPYAMKNIPVPSRKPFFKILIDKVELRITRMRWNTLFFENESKSTLSYGFKTRKCPPHHKDLMELECYPQKMISNLQFRKGNIDFLSRLKNEIRSI